MSAERLTLDLTGPASHELVREPGVGSLTVGPADTVPPPDLVVPADERPDWAALTALTTPAGDPWPRWLGYRGADPGVLAWARERPLETLRLTATAPLSLDASGSRIGHLELRADGGPLTVSLAPADLCPGITLAGDLALFTVHCAGAAPRVRLVPRPGDHLLPELAGLSGLTSLDIAHGPFDAPVDLRALRQWPALTSLTLSGAVAHLEVLAELPLRSLALRRVPDLAALPPLTTWPELGSVIVVDSDAGAARRLRAELKQLAPSDAYRSVSTPRTRAWLAEHDGSPFSGWPRATARTATAAYRTAVTEVAASADEAGALDAIGRFTVAANALPGIETTEREALADAVARLAALADPPVALDAALRRFDADRDF